MEVYGRKIRNSYVRSALVVAGTSISVLFVSVLLIFAVMPQAPFVDVLYELTSAVGTVGLSRGLTAVVNTPAKWIIIFTMYLGRIGPLTLGRGSCVPCAEAHQGCTSGRREYYDRIGNGVCGRHYPA